MKEENKIINGNLDKILWVIAFPIVLTNMIEGMYGIIDSLFVANVGTIAVASVAFVGPIQDTLIAIGTGLSIAGCSIIARYIGAGDEAHARKAIGTLASVGVAVGFCVSLFAFVFADFLLLNAGVTESLLVDARIYLRLTSWGVVFNFINLLYLAIARAQGNTKVAIFINVCSIGLKIIFCYLLTIWQDYGIAGIGVATILAQGACAAACVYAMFSNRNPRLLTLHEYFLDLPIFKILLITALPLIVEKSLIAYGYVIINKYVLAFGESVLAAYGLANKVNTVFFKSVTAIGTGLSVVIAQNLGAGKPERAKKAVWKALFYAVALSMFFLLFVLPWRSQIASLFVDTTESTYGYMIDAMSIYTASIIAWGITECVLGIFQGVGKTKYNLLISLVRIYALRVPVVIIFSQEVWGLQEKGIWYAMLVSNILCAMFSLSLYLFRRNKVMVSTIPVAQEEPSA